MEIDMEKVLDQIIIIAPFTYSLQLENKNKNGTLGVFIFNIALINIILD